MSKGVLGNDPFARGAAPQDAEKPVREKKAKKPALKPDASPSKRAIAAMLARPKVEAAPAKAPKATKAKASKTKKAQERKPSPPPPPAPRSAKSAIAKLTIPQPPRRAPAPPVTPPLPSTRKSTPPRPPPKPNVRPPARTPPVGKVMLKKGGQSVAARPSPPLKRRPATPPPPKPKPAFTEPVSFTVEGDTQHATPPQPPPPPPGRPPVVRRKLAGADTKPLPPPLPPPPPPKVTVPTRLMREPNEVRPTARRPAPPVPRATPTVRVEPIAHPESPSLPADPAPHAGAPELIAVLGKGTTPHAGSPSVVSETKGAPVPHPSSPMQVAHRAAVLGRDGKEAPYVSSRPPDDIDARFPEIPAEKATPPAPAIRATDEVDLSAAAAPAFAEVDDDDDVVDAPADDGADELDAKAHGTVDASDDVAAPDDDAADERDTARSAGSAERDVADDEGVSDAPDASSGSTASGDDRHERVSASEAAPRFEAGVAGAAAAIQAVRAASKGMARPLFEAASGVAKAAATALGLGSPAQVDDWGKDGELTRSLHPLGDFLYEKYWRVSVDGADHVPTGGCLIIANHSGALPFDGPVLSLALERERADLEKARWLLEDQIFHAPVMGVLMNRVGAVRAHPDNAVRLLGEQRPVIVFPEGFLGMSKPFADRYKLKRFGRGGFIKLAVRQQVPVVPVAIVGAEESMPLLARLPSSAFGLPYLPLTTPPLPARWHIRFGAPIDLSDAPAAGADDLAWVQRANDRTRDTIASMLEAMLRERSKVF